MILPQGRHCITAVFLLGDHFHKYWRRITIKNFIIVSRPMTYLVLSTAAAAAIFLTTGWVASADTFGPRTLNSTVTFAKAYSDHMVLQSAPKRAQVWGWYAPGTRTSPQPLRWPKLADTAGPAAQTMSSSIGSVRPFPSKFHADTCNIDESTPHFLQLRYYRCCSCP